MSEHSEVQENMIGALTDNLALYENKLKLKNKLANAKNIIVKSTALNENMTVLNEGSSSLKAKISTLNEESSSLNEKMTALNKESSSLNEKMNALTEESSSLFDKMDALTEEFSSLNGCANDFIQEIASLVDDENISGETSDSSFDCIFCGTSMRSLLLLKIHVIRCPLFNTKRKHDGESTSGTQEKKNKPNEN